MSIRWEKILGVGLLWSAPAPALAQSTWYSLVNVETDLCVDVPGFSQANVLVQQYPCNGGNNQYWRLVSSPWAGWYTVENLSSRKCLDLPGGSPDNGTLIQQYDCHGGFNQLWYKVSHGNGEFSLVNASHSKCLDAAGDDPGYNLVQWTCHYLDHQRFEYGPIAVHLSH